MGLPASRCREYIMVVNSGAHVQIHVYIYIYTHIGILGW